MGMQAIIEQTIIEQDSTELLRRAPKRAFRKRYDAADLSSAIYSAATCARQSDQPCYVYESGHYMTRVYRVTFKRSEATCRIGNIRTDRRFYTVQPDLTITRTERQSA